MFDKHHKPIKINVKLISDKYPEAEFTKVIAIGGGFAFLIHDHKGSKPWSLTEEELIKSSWVVKEK